MDVVGERLAYYMRDMGGGCLCLRGDVVGYAQTTHVDFSGENTTMVVAKQCLKQHEA